MSATDRHDRVAELLAGLIADPQLRARFERNPGRSCREFHLPGLAAELQAGERGTVLLERRESRSSLGGAMIAAAAEAISLAEMAVDQVAGLWSAGGDATPADQPGGVRAPRGRAVDGPAGASGSSGAPGSSGASGSSGAPGSSGASGSSGAPGSSGGSGSSGAPGSSGAHTSGAPASEPGAAADVRRVLGPPSATGERGQTNYPGADASRPQVASWMARHAAAAGLPEELPVMAALDQSGLREEGSPDRDAAGFFRMSLNAWNLGPYKGFAEDPDLQLAWFLDRAAVVRAERVAAGDSAFGRDPASWQGWIRAAIQRPESPGAGGGGGQLEAAQRVLEEARPRAADASSAPSAVAESAVQVARRYLGQPYLWGGSTPATGFDCSGLVQYAYGQAGVTLPRVTHEQFVVGERVGREELRGGDIVFFRDATGYIHHEGLYLGDGEFLHAPRTGDVIKVSRLDEPYFAQQFAGGRRVGQMARPAASTGGV